jgi:hypothetical protein
MDQIATGAPVPPSRVIRNYPEALEAIVMRLLASSPDARYQTAGEALEAIETYATTTGLLTSAHVVARFMKELFEQQHATGQFERETHDFIRPTTKTPNEFPEALPDLLVRAADEETTTSFGRIEQLLWTPEAKVKVRTPKRTDASEEISVTSSQAAFHEQTRQDVVLAFDPIDARSDEILDQLDADAPSNESRERRTERHIMTLVARALEWVELGELDKAVTAVELALEEGMATPAGEQLLQDRVGAIVAVYEAMLEDPYRVLALARPLEELAGVAMDPGARTLLTGIDGATHIQQLVTRAGMPRLEAYHHLCQLLMRGVVR